MCACVYLFCTYSTSLGYVFSYVLVPILWSFAECRVLLFSRCYQWEQLPCLNIGIYCSQDIRRELTSLTGLFTPRTLVRDAVRSRIILNTQPCKVLSQSSWALNSSTLWRCSFHVWVWPFQASSLLRCIASKHEGPYPWILTIFFGSSSLHGFISQHSTKQISEETKVCSPEFQACEHAVCLPQCPKDLEVPLLVSAAKVTFKLFIGNLVLLFVGSSVAPLLIGYSVIWEINFHWHTLGL